LKSVLLLNILPGLFCAAKIIRNDYMLRKKIVVEKNGVKGRGVGEWKNG